MSNAIRVIAPYRYEGTWVFDDPDVDLLREPFVAGMPEMIDELVKDIGDAHTGFRLLFSDRPFPEYQWRMTRMKEEMGGYWYRVEALEMRGWLCPAMFRYFENAPGEIYIKAEPRR